MILQNSDGAEAQNEEQAQELTDLGFKRCYGSEQKGLRKGEPCRFFLAPETQQNVLDQSTGYYTCPKCKTSHDLMEDVPFHGIDQDYSDFSVGGGTRIGIPLAQQGQIGEDLIQGLHSIPGYGSIVWWHEGGAVARSPLDGATKEWGIEVKTIGYDSVHHRFIPGSPEIKEAKNQMVKQMGLKGTLGVLVLLNYRASTADIYVKEFPEGVGAFRSSSGYHLLEKVPFENPLTDPHSGLPSVQSEETPF